jgi:hypothetical protein
MNRPSELLQRGPKQKAIAIAMALKTFISTRFLYANRYPLRSKTLSAAGIGRALQCACYASQIVARSMDRRSVVLRVCTTLKPTNSVFD